MSTNVNISRILHAAFFTPAPEGFWGLNILLWGPPGAGKTSLVKALCQASGLHYERLSPAERGEGQFGVVPVPGTDGFLHYPAPAWVQQFAQGGVLFLDEVNTAPPALQAPLLGLSQLRTLGTHVFNHRTRVVAAANEVQDAAGGWDLAPATANRFCHIVYEGLAARTWAQALLSGFGRDSAPAAPAEPAADIEAKVMLRWPAEVARARGVVASFIQAKPGLAHAAPRLEDNTASKAWPSRRSWEYVVHALAGATIHNLTAEETQMLVQGFVGEAAAIEFYSWMQNMDLPDPVALLDGQVKWSIDLDRLDRTMAVLNVATAMVKPINAERRNPRGVVLWSIVADLLSKAPDIAIVFAQQLLTVENGQKALMPPEAFAAIGALSPYLLASGYTMPAR